MGGTWARAVALDAAGRRRAAARRVTAAGTLAARVQQAVAALRLGPGRLGSLVVATRGVWTGRERLRARGTLVPLAPAVRVMSDVEAAYLGALGPTPGILLLAGTGSIALGRDAAGRWRRAGGLGPLLGDEGSAFSIGRAWLRAGPGRQNLAHLRRLGAAPDAVARIAAQAPRALRAARRGDRAARAIANEAQVRLAAVVIEVAAHLLPPRPLPVSWAGSLLGDPWFRQGVWRQVRRAGLAISVRVPAAPAAEAAARMAASLRPRGAPAARDR